MKVRIPNNWVPRDDQMALWAYMEDGGKRAVEVAHRRWGKDDVALHFTATAAHERVGNYWHMLPQYNQGRKVIWDAVNPVTGTRRIDEAFPPAIRTRIRNTDMMIELKCGSIWQIVGSDNYDSYVGSPPIGIVLSEWAVSNPMSWAYLSPILEQNDGWALFIYTSRGKNHGKTTYEFGKATDGWFAQRLKADETPVFNDIQLQNIKNEYLNIYGDSLGMALYEQEYYCSFEGAIIGAYYTREMREAYDQKRITKVPYQVGIEVDTAWDLGVDDSMSIWFFQPIGTGFHFIDYYESSGYGMAHYAQVLKEKDYLYGNHWMPHDAAARVLSEGEIAKSPMEMAEDVGIKPVNVVERPRNMDVIIKQHIPAVRNMISTCWFDEDKCAQGIACLENYRSEYDEEKKVMGLRPLHDWSSHGADAFRTFTVGYKQPEEVESPVRINLAAGRGQHGWMM